MQIKSGERNVTSCHPFLCCSRVPPGQFIDILIFFIIIAYFVKAGHYELADYMKKHEIVNKIKSRITRASIIYYTLFINFLLFSVKDQKVTKITEKGCNFLNITWKETLKPD